MIHRKFKPGQPHGIGMTSQGTRDRLVRRLREHGIRDESVLRAIGSTPRHEFVDEALASRAYEDTALPIGLGQTISQPWVVAKMTEAVLDGGSPQKVLEVGDADGARPFQQAPQHEGGGPGILEGAVVVVVPGLRGAVRADPAG